MAMLMTFAICAAIFGAALLAVVERVWNQK